jgi:hypothetical protein
LCDLGRTYDEIEKLFEQLQRVYQSTSLTLVRSPLGRIFAERLPRWHALYPNWGRTIVLEPPQQDVVGDFDPSHLGLGLDTLVAWRAGSGDSRQPRLAWRTVGEEFEVLWQESPGSMATRDLPCADSPLECSSGDCTGSLALSVLGRVADDHGGSLQAQRDPGLNVLIRWPQFRAGDRSR